MGPLDPVEAKRAEDTGSEEGREEEEVIWMQKNDEKEKKSGWQKAKLWIFAIGLATAAAEVGYIAYNSCDPLPFDFDCDGSHSQREVTTMALMGTSLGLIGIVSGRYYMSNREGSEKAEKKAEEYGHVKSV